MKLFIPTFLMLFASTLFSQNKLVVNYRFNYQFDTSTPTDPKTIALYKASNNNTGDYILITSKDESLFNKIEKLDNNQKDSNINNIPVPSGMNYINFNDEINIYNLEFKGQKILIKDSLSSFKWIIQKDREKYLGYDVKKAFAKNNNIIYEVWFAPDLPFKSGPGLIWGLPGIILKLEIIMNQSDGIHKRYYNATKIELNNNAIITKPSKGKVFTEKEFIKYFNEQLKIEAEMKNNRIDTKID